MLTTKAASAAFEVDDKPQVAFEFVTEQQRQSGTRTRREYGPCRLGWRVHAPNGQLIRSASAAVKLLCCYRKKPGARSSLGLSVVSKAASAAFFYGKKWQTGLLLQIGDGRKISCL